jgi:hypothetical protein
MPGIVRSCNFPEAAFASAHLSPLTLESALAHAGDAVSFAA